MDMGKLTLDAFPWDNWKLGMQELSEGAWEFLLIHLVSPDPSWSHSPAV